MPTLWLSAHAEWPLLISERGVPFLRDGIQYGFWLIIILIFRNEIRRLRSAIERLLDRITSIKGLGGEITLCRPEQSGTIVGKVKEKSAETPDSIRGSQLPGLPTRPLGIIEGGSPGTGRLSSKDPD